MATSINTLLNKKKWRGEEVGKALIANLVNDYTMRATPGHPPLFSQSDLDRMAAGLESDRDKRAYRDYVNLYNGIVIQNNRAEALRQQAQHGYFRLLMYITNAHNTEDAGRALENLPVIMTEKQYNETIAKREAEKRAFTESHSSLIFHTLAYYLGEYAEEGNKPKVPKPIKDALQALKKRPFTNKHILGLINKEYDIGYQLFPNGKRSDQITEEERLAEFRALGNSAAEAVSLLSEGDVDGEGATELRLKNIKKQWDGAGEAKEEWPKWVVDPDPPEGLTCWDVLAGDYDMRDVYSGALAEYSGKEEALFKEFTADFPDLYKALKEDMEKHKCLKHLADTKPAKYFKEVITWGELADAGAYNYQEMIKPSVGVICDIYGDEDGADAPQRRRAAKSGIAIIKTDTVNESTIDDNGYYKEHAYNGLATILGSIEMMDLSEGVRETIQTARDVLIIPALKEVSAYHALLSLLGERYKVPELDEMKPDMKPIIEQIKGLNNLVLSLFLDTEGKPEKQVIIKNLFPLIDLNNISPQEKAIEAVRDKLEDHKATIDLSELGGLVKELSVEGEGG
jgi:hypothetical protein